MKLSESQREQVQSKLQELVGKAPKCSVCDLSQWVVSDTVFELREFQGGSLMLGGDAIILPVISMTCSNCGNTIFFNAITLGVLSSKEAAAAEIEQ